MKNNMLNLIIAVCLTSFTSCSQSNKSKEINHPEASSKKKDKLIQEPHRYGGWYCPDNLNGFPPTNLADWKNVPVIEGRMPTKEETQSQSSLIFVDKDKYPNAKAFPINLPQLAKVYNRYSKREEVIIIIQAFTINNDTIVGYRFLNGGNGSGHLREVEFIKENENGSDVLAKFISINIKINNTQDAIWKVLTEKKYAKEFKISSEETKKPKATCNTQSHVNFNYPNAGPKTASYADLLFGSFYIQRDYSQANYTEKFFLGENDDASQTELKIVCGPYLEDYNSQLKIINEWAKKVKMLSEKQ